jgi:general secretion pathway protein G
MTTCEQGTRGFTLLELIVVLAVLGLLLGTAVPLASAVVQSDRRQEVQRELADLAQALEAAWFERAAFPTTLTASGFLGVQLQPGVANSGIEDPFAAGQQYRYQVDANAGTATVWSIGENGVDNGAANEEFVVRVFAAVPGSRRTWQRLRLIVELLANHIESGGAVAGTWPVVRAAIGLPAEFDRDGFGTEFSWTAATHALRSAGPDRTLGNADDITL